MLKEERLDYILRKLQTDHKVLQTELSNDLQVSEDTVRRDLESLAQTGQLIKVRGGAIPHSPNPYSFKDRIKHHQDDKRNMAEKALQFLHNGQTIILDGGTSTLTLVKLFPPNLHIKVITNSVPIVSQLIEHPVIEVVFTGGLIGKDSQTAGGLDTIRMLEKVRADICFLGICSLHPTAGVTGLELGEADVKSVMVASAYKTIALSTTDKMGTAEPFKVCNITDLDTIVTDNPDLPSVKPYINLGIQVI
ncbi:transcriptional regulator, DeoR family [Chitinophaga terrae (ex Kim and Jung 2007)]|uniref:Transcriptional regulator, DeoR family n=1 Tax=Chitinophaga terrae (ex Kim and Jung 2007) TaxID=408074 RepID=A0A1H4G614_9BACT|nr:DeoR/GlpR family DNA-binding transcription regulator [Chitinophaga terrae (ex Kim and Jung 2007)]MDQ0105630.1 DeoR/GlpR family transcriptional regulator of sugar metabolism [Chitinophaga terrae (ex Kim and Jung 2007)]GEP93108.1 DeoR family transcriptional regulator [Chitinophaga terrae (ex Kim and Jung 2007)]SEB05039.1 transcriptional regulator, DeoR family [Chitinophaga terrae (ex Kim and Jung 2007)]